MKSSVFSCSEGLARAPPTQKNHDEGCYYHKVAISNYRRIKRSAFSYLSIQSSNATIPHDDKLAIPLLSENFSASYQSDDKFKFCSLEQNLYGNNMQLQIKFLLKFNY